MGMLSAITKVTEPLPLQIFGPYIITWSRAHQNKVLKASILIAQIMIKLGVSTTKIKYSTQKYIWSIKIELHEMFTRLSSPDLLNACQRGPTENQNESINNMIWSKCPKRVLCSKTRFVISVCESIIKWNEGDPGRESFLESLNVKCGPNIIAVLRKENTLRLSNARCKITEKYKKRRQVLRQLRKQNKRGNSYIPCGFQQKLSLMSILQARDQFPKYKQDVCKTITFVFNVDVQAFITLSQ